MTTKGFNSALALLLAVLLVRKASGDGGSIEGSCGNSRCTVNGRTDFCSVLGYQCCEGRDSNYIVPSRGSATKCCFDAANPVYNGRTHLCNGTTIIEKTPELDQCGDNLVIKWKTEDCFDQNPHEVYVRPKSVPLSEVGQGNYFEPPISSETSTAVVHPEMSTPPCSQEGVLCDRNKNPVRKTHPDDDQVCGTMTYNTKRQYCDYGVIRDIPEGKIQCGRGFMDLEADLCCGTSIHHNAKATMQCCEARAYDPRSHDCCLDGVRPKGTPGCRNPLPKLQVYSFATKVKKFRCKKKTNQCTITGSVMISETGNPKGASHPELRFPKAKIVLDGWPRSLVLLRGWYFIATDKELKNRTTLRYTEDWFDQLLLPMQLQSMYEAYLRIEVSDRQAKQTRRQRQRALQDID